MRRLLHSARKFKALGPARRAYLWPALRHLIVARLGHAWSSANEIIADLGVDDGDRPAAPNSFEPVLAGWAIRTLAPWLPWRSDCLIQSIAAVRWLRAEGLQPSFHLGVANNQSGEEIMAHAWVELNGVPVTPAGPVAFAPFKQSRVEQLAR